MEKLQQKHSKPTFWGGKSTSPTPGQLNLVVYGKGGRSSVQDFRMCFHKFHKALKTFSWENKSQQAGEIEVDVYHISTCIHLFIYKNIYIYTHIKHVYVRASNDTTKSTRMATDKHIASCEGRYTLDNYHLQTGWSGRIKCRLYT